MKTCWFVVINSRGTWWVDCEGKTYGPFSTPNQAQQEAKRLAEVFGDPSRKSLVLAPNDEGHHDLVWTGADPEWFPPNLGTHLKFMIVNVHIPSTRI